MSKNLSFQGLYGQDKIVLVRGIIHIEPIINVLEKNKHEVKSHTHNNLFQIFLIEQDKVDLHCYNQIIEIQARSFFTVSKNTIHGISSTPQTKGWVISISEMGLEKMLKLDADIFHDIEDITLTTFDFDNPLHLNFYNTLHKCIDEYNDSQPAKELALEYLAGMLLIRLFRILNSSSAVVIKERNSYKMQYRRFRELIKSNYSFKHTVDYYANHLSISASHLTRICKEVGNETPKRIIANFFINEAKIFLTRSDYSISDVAYKLGFDDPSHFARLFKKIAGITPSNFRKEIGL